MSVSSPLSRSLVQRMFSLPRNWLQISSCSSLSARLSSTTATSTSSSSSQDIAEQNPEDEFHLNYLEGERKGKYSFLKRNIAKQFSGSL